MNDKRKVVAIEGQVEIEIVGKGTASEHQGVVLTTNDGRKHTLQRIGGNPFADIDTQALAGRRVRVEGYDLGSVFRFTQAHEVSVKEP